MEEKKKKPLIQKIIILLLILLLIPILIGVVPFLCFVGIVLFHMFFIIPEQPQIEQAFFPFTLVYEYDGEQTVIQDTMVYEYEGYSFALDGGNTRDWASYALENEEAPFYYLEGEEEEEIYIYIPMEAEYYMGAPITYEIPQPYIYYSNQETGETKTDEREIEEIGIKIIRWEASPPIKNEYR